MILVIKNPFANAGHIYLIYIYELIWPLKRNEILICATTWMKLGSIAKCKKPDTKGCMLCDSVYMICPE